MRSAVEHNPCRYRRTRMKFSGWSVPAGIRNTQASFAFTDTENAAAFWDKLFQFSPGVAEIRPVTPHDDLIRGTGRGDVCQAKEFLRRGCCYRVAAAPDTISLLGTRIMPPVTRSLGTAGPRSPSTSSARNDSRLASSRSLCPCLVILEPTFIHQVGFPPWIRHAAHHTPLLAAHR
jgi:hypothetical protein